jgi:phenylacetate-CoA ligase
MLSEAQRHPLLNDEARRRLLSWREHPQAPRWNIVCGDRLDAKALEDVRAFARSCEQPTSYSAMPPWEFARMCLRDVPFYRARGGSVEDWNSIPPCDRLDLAREPWSFVPDGLGLGEMVVYNTSGTTGSEAKIPAHWEWPSTYLPLFEAALSLRGLNWPALRWSEPERVALATVAAQEHTLTFASWSSYLESTYLKVNLHAGQWRSKGDAVEFLNQADPQVICGDPVSLAALCDTSFAGRPLAVLSSAIALSPELRDEMEARLRCPVIDLYSLTEIGPIACDIGAGMQVLAPDILVEILRPNGSHCEESELGEITLTGGRNQFLPLLRYRTGDFARAQVLGGVLFLRDFHGRQLVKFSAMGESGAREVLDIDVTHALRLLPLREFSLHQSRDGSLCFRFRGLVAENDIEAALRSVFFLNPLSIEPLGAMPSGERKLIRYSSDASTCTGSPSRTSPSSSTLA